MLRRSASRTATPKLAVLLLVAACSRGQQDKDQGSAAPSGEATSAHDSLSTTTSTAALSSPERGLGAASSASNGGPSAPPVSESEIRAASIQFLQTWVHAQNSGDANLYRSLYHPKEFTGLKRGHTGKSTEMQFDAWMKDRTAMFQTPFEVAAEAPLVKTWLDTGSILRAGVSRIEFTQRWRNATYADHGPKVLALWRNPDTGVQQIVFEAMLQSSASWEDPTPVAATSSVTAPSVTPSASISGAAPQAPVVFDFSQGLGSVGLTMHNAEAIASAALATPQLGAFAKALVRYGSLDCLRHVQYDQCGSTEEDWSTVDRALVDHACVRRAALLPILSSGLLGPSEVSSMQSELLTIPALESVDAALLQALAKALKRLPKDSVVPYARIAADQRTQADAYRALYAMLDPDAAFKVAYQTRKPEPVRSLDVVRYATDLHAMHAVGIRLPIEQMSRVLEVLFATRQTALLEASTQDESCTLSMLAADALGRLGDPRYLPSWAKLKTERDAERAACMLLHDPDPVRKKAELSKFFHPSKPALALEMTTVIPTSEEGAKELILAESKQTPKERALVKQITALFGDRPSGGYSSASESPLSAADVDRLMLTTAFEEWTGSTYQRVDFFEEGGHVYLLHLATLELDDRTCPC